MSQILGIHDTETYDAVRFKSWRRAILLAFPNGSAPLTALLSLMKSEPVDDPEHHWFEKDMPTQSANLTAAYTNTATTISVSDNVFRPGHLIKNLTSSVGEVMKVVSVSANGLTLTVERGNYGPTAASVGSNDTIVVIGNANSEGSGAPQSIAYSPRENYNYTQIFKTPFEVTGTALNTPVKWDPEGPWTERMREALNLHSIEMEKSTIWGVRAKYVNSSTGRIERTMGGLVSFIPASNIIDANTLTPANTLKPSLWESYMEVVFRKCLNNRQEKLALCGSGFVRVFAATMQKSPGFTMNLMPKEDTFGMKLYEYVSPHGTLYFKTHPLFSQIPAWRHNCLIIDLPGLRFRPKRGRDTFRQKNIQANDEDVRRDQFFTEATLEVNHGDAFMLLKNFTIAGAD
ncbi:MAG: DUF5309 family protein [Candidatus Caldarchaeum sp.]